MRPTGYKRKLCVHEKDKLGFARDCGKGAWGFPEYDENILELDRAVVVQHGDVLNGTELFTLKWLILYYVNFTVIRKRNTGWGNAL
jgi:hypothetical protein